MQSVLLSIGRRHPTRTRGEFGAKRAKLGDSGRTDGTPIFAASASLEALFGYCGSGRRWHVIVSRADLCGVSDSHYFARPSDFWSNAQWARWRAVSDV